MTTNEPPPDHPDRPESPTSGLPAYGSVPPPPGADYPPPVPGPVPFSATDAIGYGWKKFRENLGPILIAALVLIVASILVSFIAGAVTGTGFNESELSVAGAISQLLTQVVGYIISAAIIRGALDIVEGHKFDLMAAFGKLNLLNVVLTSILVSILTIVGFILLIIPGLIVVFFTLFTMYFVVDKDASPVEAIKLSFALVKANIGNTVVLILLSIVVVIAGFLALCVGLLVALPVLAIAWAYAYKSYLGEPVAP